MDYTSRYIAEIYSSFFCCNLHFTNPLAISDSEFVSDLFDYLVAFAIFRPRVYNDVDGNTFKEYNTSVPSIAQVGIRIDNNLSIDSDFINVLSDMTSTFQEVVRSLNSATATVISNLRQKFSAFLTICYNLFRYGTGAIALQDAIINIVGILMSTSIPDTVVADIHKIFTKTEAQSGSEVELVFKILALSSFVLFVRKVPDEKHVTNFINKLDRIPKAFDGISKMWSHFDKISKQLWPWIETTILQRENKFPNTVLLDDVVDWSEELAELLELAKRNEIKRDMATLTRASRMYARGIRLMKHCTSIKLNRANTDMIARLLPAAKLLADDAMKSGAYKSKLRQEPIIVWFSGGSGVGKTGLSYPFIMDMMRTFGEIPKTWQQDIYARMPELEYWDGYTDQEYILFDDAFQIKDSQLKPNPELFEIIRLGNSFPYQLHMASIEEKNNTFATPKFVLLTSNLENIKVESLNCPTAVTRRIDFAFRVTTVPDYIKTYTDANGVVKERLDAQKARASANAVLNFDVYEFELYDAESGNIIQSHLCYRDVVALVQEKMRRSFEYHTDITDFLDSYRSLLPGNTVAQIGDDSIVRSVINDFAAYSFFRNIVPYSLSYINSTCFNMYNKVKFNYKKEKHILDTLWDSEDPSVRQNLYSYFSYQTYRSINYFKNEKFSIRKTLQNVLGTSWTIFKACCATSAVAFTAWLAYRTTKQVVHEICVPQHIRDERELFDLASNATKCMDADCKSCSKCKFFPDDPLCVKWYTDCYCYATQMEATNKFSQLYSNSLLSHKPAKKNIKMTPQILLQMVESMINCDCDNCPTCQDNDLQHKFSHVAKVHNIPCICILSRLNQNFALCEVLSLIKFVGDQDVGIIKNIYLRSLYQTMSNDVNYYEDTPEGKKLIEDVVAYQSALYSQDIKPVRAAARVQYQGIYQGDISLNKAQRALSVRYQEGGDDTQHKIVEIITPTPQRRAPEEDLSSDTIVNHVVYPNTLYMIGHRINDEGKEVERSFGHILFVAGRIALMPYHFYIVFEELKFTHISLYSYTRMTQKIPVKDLTNTYRFPQKDAILVEFPVIVNCYKNIVNHFIDLEDYPRVKNCPGTLARLEYRDHSTTLAKFMSDSISVSESEDVNTIEIPGIGPQNNIIRSRHYYSYKMPTRAGDCGAALVVSNSAVQGKILGIHNSGSPGLTHGNAVALNKHILTLALSNFSQIAQYAYESTPLTVELETLADAGSFLVHDTHKNERISASVKSNLAPSPCFNALIKSPNLPGKLRPFVNADGVLLDPMALQRKKYGVPRPYLEPDLVDSIKESVKPLYYKENTPDPDYYHYPLTTEQAIIGIEGDPYVNAINRSTAPGYPYTFNKGGMTGKKKWFGFEQDYDLTGPACLELLADVEKLKLSILDNVRPEVVWIDTLKDAKIPAPKVNIGKTRLFTAAPMHYVIAMREMCLPFVAHCSRNRISNSIAVGTNPSSPEWSQIAYRLKEKGKHVIAGDYSNYDGTLPCQFVFAATQIMAEWYVLHWDEVISRGRNVVCGRELDQQQFREYLEKLYFECVHHLHIMNHANGTLLYNVRNGIPSGCPVTAILNSMVNLFSLSYCWMKIQEGTSKENMTSFFECCTHIFYGDDFIMNIREDVVPVYNQETITIAMKKYLDMDMTDEAKTGEIVTSRLLSEVAFLKRKFRWEDTICEYVAPLQLDVILDSTNWVRLGNETPTLIVISTLESAVRELALHQQEIDKQWRDKIVELGIRLTNRCPGRMFVHDSRGTTLRNVKNSLWECNIGF
uniref:RNA-directed RNA polymerase n=1 Tax=Giant panda Dicistroviridae TaxID=2903096 RepID=A0A8K1ZLQ4_9VIRU|nr:MAG: hypothetical protein 1 [Giant panda Dicistroviridae]